jgi:hypothetical protein
MNFIEEWFLEDITVCDRILDFYNTSEYSLSRRCPGETDRGVNLEHKDSIDLSITGSNLYDIPCIVEYFYQLQNVCNKYIEKYEWCNSYSPWSVIEGINIQYYPPGGGFKKWHTERGRSGYPMATRHLVFQTYLNTVDDGGETQFYYQDIKIKAEKGKTVIWPVDWTHTHRGIVSKTQEKYILTGWFNYEDNR